MTSHDPRAHSPDPAHSSTLLQRFFPAFLLLAALATFGLARYAPAQIDADAIAYMDIADCLRSHQWACAVNGYFHPLYPAFLALGRLLFHAALNDETRADYTVNLIVVLLCMAAVTFFAGSLATLRASLEPGGTATAFLIDRTSLQYIGVALLLFATEREFALGILRPDALLAALLLAALAALLRFLVAGRLAWAALTGLALGFAFLTKSFAFVFTLASIAALLLCGLLWTTRRAYTISRGRNLTGALLILLCFAASAGPYIAALSHAKGRLDFGDSGELNYAWYTDRTSRVHLQPYMTSQFGASAVLLKHPQPELLRTPQILSYASLPWGTNPDWFDPSYWYDGVHPRFNLRFLLSRAARNLVLTSSYCEDHPEALILLAIFAVLAGPAAMRSASLRANSFWLPTTALALTAWGTYLAVNVEPRYVTFAFIALLLTAFAVLRSPDASRAQLRAFAPVLALLLAVLAAGQSLRLGLEARRDLADDNLPGGWYSVPMHDAAHALGQLGVRPGDAVACIGTSACLAQFYWARLAGVRILVEIASPHELPYPLLRDLPNRDQAIAVVRAQGAKALVADFQNTRVSTSDPFFRQWHQLGDTTLYALPLNLPPAQPAPPPLR